MASEIKILLVDDSSLARKMIKKLIENDPLISVVAEAEDGRVALEKLKTLEVDLAIVDFEMPNMNGLEFLKALDSSLVIRKPAVIICSSLTRKGSKHTIDCLLAGAKDYILKPDASSDLVEIQKNIIEKIHSVAIDPKKSKVSKVITVAKPIEKLKPIQLRNPGLVLIGSSTGGPPALEKVLKDIPTNFPFPILIVQHMPANFTTSLTNSLNNSIQLPVIEVKEETKIEKGKVYLAAGGKHMIMKDSQTLDWVDGDLINFCRPAVDALFNTVADHYKKSVLTVILTGMGDDGYKGIAKLKENIECFSLIQDEESSVVWGMPRAVYDAGLYDQIAPLDKIGEQIANTGFVNQGKY